MDKTAEWCIQAQRLLISKRKATFVVRETSELSWWTEAGTKTGGASGMSRNIEQWERYPLNRPENSRRTCLIGPVIVTVEIGS